MEFLVGQRWVSHADSDLGLGVVVDVDGRRVTLAFPAVEEERTYAANNAPLTRLRFKVGDEIKTNSQLQVEVTGIEEQQGLLVYVGIDAQQTRHVISELELDAFIELTNPGQRLLNGHYDKNTEFALRVATLSHFDRWQRSTVRGLLGSRTSLLPHQLYIAYQVGQRHAPRVLLADEVGLGKTIEAGMILQQQLLTGRAQRVLVLVPPTLLHQWLVEMLRRFNLHFALFDEARLTDAQLAIETPDDASCAEQFCDEISSEAAPVEDGPLPEEPTELPIELNPFDTEQLILTSIDLLLTDPDMQRQVERSEWDLVVVDEAHHLQWSVVEQGRDYRLVERLAQQSKGLLLLTATPEQMGKESHFARLRLIDPSRFHDLHAFLEEEAGYRKWSDTVTALESGEAVPDLPVGLDPDAPADQLIDEILDRYGTGRVLFRNTRAAVAGFPQRILQRHPLQGTVNYPHKGVSVDHELHPELDPEINDWIEQDPRVTWLVQTLKEMRPAKALVICAHQDTAIALEHHLHMRAGIRSSAFYEGLSLIERDRAAAYFADEVNGAQTLVCSEIGSEGRNFQFAQHLILFDLPLNPDLLEQRIGRLDRIGQRNDVHIHVPYIENTAQETLFDWFDQGLNAFRESCSAGLVIFETFRERLLAQLQHRDATLATLLQDTAEFTAKTREELSAGRDRLLERNSCNPKVAEELVAAIRALDNDEGLETFMTALCDTFGIEQEYHSERTHVLRQTDQTLVGHLPGLREDGNTATFDRQKALAREDMDFLTWEHPIVQEGLDRVLSSQLGNAAVGTLQLKGITPGTILVEIFVTTVCIAPKSLQLERFLSINPKRILLDQRGKDLSDVLPHHRLNELIQKIKKGTAVAVIKRVTGEIEQALETANNLAKKSFEVLREKALNDMHSELGAELQRLRALREVNTTIRQEELDHLETLIEQCAAHIEKAHFDIQAVRLIITT